MQQPARHHQLHVKPRKSLASLKQRRGRRRGGTAPRGGWTRNVWRSSPPGGHSARRADRRVHGALQLVMMITHKIRLLRPHAPGWCWPLLARPSPHSPELSWATIPVARLRATPSVVGSPAVAAMKRHAPGRPPAAGLRSSSCGERYAQVTSAIRRPEQPAHCTWQDAERWRSAQDKRHGLLQRRVP